MSYTSDEQIKRWRAAMDKTMKKAFAEKDRCRKLLIRAGILERNGKRLAKPYR